MQIETEVVVGFVMATAGSAVAWLAQRSIAELDRRIGAVEKRMESGEEQVADLRRDYSTMDKAQGRMDVRLEAIEKMLGDIHGDVKALLTRRASS